MLGVKKIHELKEKSREIRISILNSIHSAGRGHIGGAFSIVEILVSLYYGGILNFDSQIPGWHLRDRFLLSKGHSGVALYAVLADLNFFPKNEMELLNQGGLLGEHPDPKIPGIEAISGSLGHGLPIAAGMALADKFDKNQRMTFVLIGDGECYEGSVWEAAIFAAHNDLGNLCGIIDRNRLITYGNTEDINKLEPFKEKWEAFGWTVVEINAHDFQDLLQTFNEFKEQKNIRPTMVIANSIKGKGVSFMENSPSWHHGGISDEVFLTAYSELVGNEFHE